MRILFLVFVLLGSGAASAQTPGSCALGRAEGDLNVSNVFARVFNTGSLFYGNITTAGDGYWVPQNEAASPLFAAGLWMGGQVDGSTRTAGGRYSGFTFWPGPLDDGATLPNASDCSAYDRIYVVTPTAVAQYESGFGATADLAEWPVGLGAPAVTASGAPVEPSSRDQVIDLAAGERPVLYGSQTAWWVMNDVGNAHTQQQTAPLGIEVRVAAFEVTSGAVSGARDATFYRYEIINRNSDPIEGGRAGVFVDPDLGDASDDFVSSDSTRGMFVAYNGASFDNLYGTPPALGIDLLSGAGGSMQFFGGWSSQTAMPVLGSEYYNYLQSRWRDGSEMRSYGDGYNESQGSIVEWAYPGDPVAGASWSEENINGQGTRNSSGDRSGVIATPEFALEPGERYVLDFAILFAQGTTRLNSVVRLRGVSDAVQAAYDAGDLFPSMEVSAGEEEEPPAPTIDELRLTVQPNPSSGMGTIRLALPSRESVRVRVIDALGREVAVIADGDFPMGEHPLALPSALAAGVYTVEVRTPTTTASRMLTVVR